MDWKEKIKKAITMLIEGCKENDEWYKCWECPFREYCDVIEESSDLGIPSDW